MISSHPPALEGGKRPTGAPALDLGQLSAQLDHHLDDPAGVLETLAALASKGENVVEVWSKLHRVAERLGKAADLALGYETLIRDPRIERLGADSLALIHLRAAEFFSTVLEDSDGAVSHAEQALAAFAGQPDALRLLEHLLMRSGKVAQLAGILAAESSRTGDPPASLALLQRAFKIAAEGEVESEAVIDWGNRLLAANPSDSSVRDQVMRRLLALGRHREVAELLESALRSQPPPAPEEAALHREQLVDLCHTVLKDPERAMAHVEDILSTDPTNALARQTARDLFQNPGLKLRAAAALSDAFEEAGERARALQMLQSELEQVRGPRRIEVQRRLAILREEVLGDREGAFELLGPVIAGNPSDDALRERFVALGIALGQSEQVTRLLVRTLGTQKDRGLRARLGLDVGRVHWATGDRKRARAVFEKVLEANADDGATLSAANTLSEMTAEDGDERVIARILEAQVRLEPERAARQVAARRLMQLSDVGGSVPDPRRTLLALRALVDSPWSEEALGRLEAVYAGQGDDAGLSDVLAFRAERSASPEAACELRERALELRTRGLQDSSALIDAYFSFIKTFGHSREVHARLAPLLERADRHQELADVLLSALDLAPSEEQVHLWFRVAELRRSHLSDPEGALEALTWAVALDPEHEESRSLLESLLESGASQLRAAAILEPLYRKLDYFSGLIRVFEVRAETEPEASDRLDAAEQFLRLHTDGSEAGLERRLRLVGQALRDALEHAPERFSEWLERLEQLAKPDGQSRALADVLASILGDRPIDSPLLFELASSLGRGLKAVGDRPGALEAYRRALRFDPTSSALVGAIDELLAEQGSPLDRVRLYQAALEHEVDALRKRQLRHAMGRLMRFELGDLPGAIAVFERLVQDDASDEAAHEALVETLEARGDTVRVASELETLLTKQAPSHQGRTLLRLADVHEKAGNPQQALASYRRILESAEQSADILAKIERFAAQHGAGETVIEALRRQFALATEPPTRVDLLERMGDALLQWKKDPSSASAHWLDGAGLARDAGDFERSRGLYERVLKVDPKRTEAAARLIELSAFAGDFARLGSAFGAFLETASDDQVEAALFALEHRALACQATSDFVGFVERFLQRVDDSARTQRLKLLKARSLAAMPGTREAASSIFRELLQEAQGEAPDVCDAFERLIATIEPPAARASDLRALYQFRLDRASDPAGLLVAWAAAEARELGDPLAAIRLLRVAIEHDPGRLQAYLDRACLEADAGEEPRALLTLEELFARAKPEDQRAAQLGAAQVYLERLGRPLEGLRWVESVLRIEPGDREALELVHRALVHPAARSQALQLLEQTAKAACAADPTRRFEVLGELLRACGGDPDLAAERTRWVGMLLENGEGPEATLGLALRGAVLAPAELELWRAAERIARLLENPEPVADAYARVLEQGIPENLADPLGRLMVDFHEEWFDDPARVVGLLKRVLELSPRTSWAFDRLKLAFNANGNWQELFALYDLQLSNLDASQRVELFREAAMAARDFANDPGRAIGYLEALHRLVPTDSHVESALERLYERQERKRPLIELLSKRLPSLDPAEQNAMRSRIAKLWLDLLEPEPALELAERLYAEPDGQQEAVGLLERLIALPLSESAVQEPSQSTVLRATARLKAHYSARAQVADVVRMLQIEVRETHTLPERRALLEQVIELLLHELRDVTRAFEATSELVSLDPENSAYRKQLADLATQAGAEIRRVEVLVSAARQLPVLSRTGLLSEAASVCRHAIGDELRAIELYQEVIQSSQVPISVELGALRELSTLLRTHGTPLERAGLLERLADREDQPSQRRAALGEAAELAFDALSDPGRALAGYEKCIADNPADLDAMNGLCRALEVLCNWERLIPALEARAAIQSEAAARADRVRVAQLHEAKQGDRAEAIEAWRRVVAKHGGDSQSFGALSELLASEGRWQELGELLADEVEATTDATQRRQLLLDLGKLHEEHTQDWPAALDAFVAAEDWSSAARVVGSSGADPEAGCRVSARLLTQAVAIWRAQGTGPESPAAKSAEWALGDLCQRLLTLERYDELVERLLAGADLELPVQKRRELVREAAYLSAEQLGDRARAIELFEGLLDQDDADPIAASSVDRLAQLLEEQGRFEAIAALWENQATVRVQAGDPGAARTLLAIAGQIAEERLQDLERAVAAHQRGAELGGETCLEALARIFAAQGQIDQVARALERLCALSSTEQLATRALRLASAYSELGKPGRAREALEQALPRVEDSRELRQRLAELYREGEDFGALARLFEENAGLTSDPAEALSLLREAVELHLERRQQPAPAIPLLERAIAIDPVDPLLRLRLAQALYLGQRLPEATQVLSEQLERYGTRRPKDRALVHYELARVQLAASDRQGALEQLDAAAKIDPAHPKILSMLARTALEQGDSQRAERMFRALLLMAPRDGDSEMPSKSEALVSLASIARERGDQVRFEEFVTSAFDAAGANPRDLGTLERALRGLDRPDLVARALGERLSERVPAKDRAIGLADLCDLHALELGDLTAVQDRLRAHAAALETELLRKESVDDRAWEALGRALARLGDRDAEARVLERRVEASARTSRPPPSPDLYYRLAAVRLDSVETEMGLDLLDRALELGLEPTRAEGLLRGRFREGSEPPRVLDLFERSARAQSNRLELLQILIRRVGLGDADLALVREGIALSEELDKPELGDQLLRASISTGTADSVPADAAWLRLELSKRLRTGGDVPSALPLEEQAAEYLGAAEARSLLLSVARDAVALGDVDRAARLFEHLLHDDPGNQDVYGPLLDLYRQTDQVKKLLRLLEAIAPSVSSETRALLRLEQAELLLDRLGRKEEALTLLREAVREDPRQRRAHQRLLDLLDAEGQEEELIELFHAEIDAQRERGDAEAASALAHRLIAWLEKRDRISEALTACRTALKHDPGRRGLLEVQLRLTEATADPSIAGDALEAFLVADRTAATPQLIRRLVQLRETAAEPEGLQRAMELGFSVFPEDLGLCDRLALAYEQRGERERLADLFERGLRARPGNRSLIERLTEAYRQLGRHQEALSLLDTLSESFADDPFVQRVRGTLLVDLGRVPEAVDALERAASHDPAVLGDLAQALERALEFVPPEKKASIGERLVDVLERIGDLSQTRARLSSLVDQIPESHELLQRFAELQVLTGELDEGLECYSRLIDKLPGSAIPKVALTFFEVAERAGDPSRARVALERAFAVDPGNEQVFGRLAAILESDGAYRALAELLREAAEREPRREERAKKLLKVAELLLLPDGDLGQAQALLEALRSELSDSLEVVTLLARAYTEGARLEDALTLLDGCIDSYRGRRVRALAPVYEQKADVHLEEGILTDAVAALAKAFEMDPKNARIGMRLARLALESDEAELAHRALRSVAIMRTAEIDGPDGARTETKADANYLLAELAQKKGDPRKARVLAAKALSENPDHEQARELLKTLDQR